tara:strand:- start:45 stop:248 length:204 start_codon:yes stop_codon:yes gene_type:complete
MIKTDKVWLQLTRTEANALMVMLDGEMENRFQFEGLDLKEWEQLDLEAYKILAFHKYKTWYMENCDG